jgi:hypothetical protein
VLLEEIIESCLGTTDALQRAELFAEEETNHIFSKKIAIVQQTKASLAAKWTMISSQHASGEKLML